MLKNKEWKKKFLIMMICTTVVMFLIGCGDITELSTVHEGERIHNGSSRFTYAADQDVTENFTIIRDTETGVLYIFYWDGKRSGLCPLYDSKGDVMNYKEK